jgi:hypothetical protein
MSINVAVTQPENIGLTITTGNSINIGVAQIENVGVTTTTGNLISVGIDTGSLINVNIGSNGEHNSLIALQGGSQTERYHLTKAQYDSLGGDGSFDFVSLTGNQTISGVKTFVDRPYVSSDAILINGDIELNPSKANRWSVPALRVNNYYTSEGFINIYQISSGELFGGWGLIDDIDPTYPIWQSLVNDTSRCLLYKDTDSQEKLLSPFLNNANPIIATPSTDLPPWEKTWSGQSGYEYNNVQIDLVDKYQINSISEQPPSNPNAGDSWFNNQNGKTFFYYVNSGESVGQWIQI